MYTMKSTIIITNKRPPLFVGCRCHKEENRGILYFENTHKKVSIHVFLITIAQENHEKRQ